MEQPSSRELKLRTAEGGNQKPGTFIKLPKSVPCSRKTGDKELRFFPMQKDGLNSEDEVDCTVAHVQCLQL